MKRLCYMLVVLTMLLSTTVYAEEKSKPLWGFINNVGVDWSYGRDDYILPDAWCSKHSTNFVNRVVIRAESRRLIFSEKWGLQGELLYSAHKANEVPDHGQDAGFNQVGFNLALIRHFFDDMFYLGWFAGVSYVDELPRFENRDWADRYLESNLGQSHWLGSWGPMLGKDWKVYKTWSLRTEARFTHTSDPFRTDKGKNFIGWNLGITKHF